MMQRSCNISLVLLGNNNYHLMISIDRNKLMLLTLYVNMGCSVKRSPDEYTGSGSK